MRSADGRATSRIGPSIASSTIGSQLTRATSRRHPRRVEEIGGLWDRIRAAERETEALNLDRKLHIQALIAEIAATAPRR